MELQDSPCTPHGVLRHVGVGFRQLVAERFGHVYSIAALAVRHSGTSKIRYAPVFNAPGGTPAFCWPPIDLPDCWLEPMPDDLVVEKHTDSSQALLGHAAQELLVERNGHHQNLPVASGGQ